MEVIIKDGSHNHISEVVVFTDQAYIKRQVKTEAVAGLNRFLVQINAYYIEQDSIQASVFAEGEILSVQYRKVPVIEMTQENIRKLEEKQQQLKQKKQELLRDKHSIDKQKQFLEASVAYAQVEIPKELKTSFPAPEKLQNILHFLDQNFKLLNEKESALEIKLKELDDELTLTERKISQQKKPEQANKQYIEVLFLAQKARQEVKVEVFYLAGQAFWQPVYKIDVTADLATINLTTFAQIEQTTGENWRDIKLSVSNAVPLKGSKLPDQKSWYLQLSSTQIIPDADSLAYPVAAALPMAGSYLESAALDDMTDAAADYAQSERKELPLAFEFMLPQNVSIEHGSGDNLLPIRSESISGKVFHLCMPQQDVLVYLVCEAMLENTLMPGKLNIYFSGRFVASSYIEEKKAGQQLLINLGAERDIKVSREKLVDRLSDSFFGVVDRLSAVRELVYAITIENLKNKQINLHLIDAVPVSATDRIQIKDLHCQPEADIKQWQGREGVMLWDMMLDKKTDRNVQISMFVKYPKDDPPYDLF